MKKIAVFLALSLFLMGCATSIEFLRNVPKNKGKRWTKTFNYPYKQVFQATLLAIESRGDRRVVENSEEKEYIISGYGPIVLGCTWYEVYNFKEISPQETLVELVYVSSGNLAVTSEAKEEIMIKIPMFLAIENQLKLQEK